MIHHNSSLLCLFLDSSIANCWVVIDTNNQCQRRQKVRWNKKPQNALFVEDEQHHNWATARTSVNRRLVYMSILFVIMAVLFSAVR